MLRSEIRDLIRKRLGETTASFWSNTELNSWINDACTDIAFRTKCIRSNVYFTPVAETSEYVLSTVVPYVLSINEVYHKSLGTTWIKLTSTSRTELDAIYPGWKSATSGAPSQYYYNREEDVFGLYVKPDATNVGASYCQVYFTKQHIDLTLDTESPQLPENIQLAVCDYVTAYGYEQRGWGDKANDAWQKYYSRLKDYQVERNRETEDDELIMKNYRNI
jgi:hypothetical protein